MIEKGMNPNSEPNKEVGIRSVVIRLGTLIIGLSIGVAVIAILVQFNALGRSNAVPMSILGLCGGIALIVGNRLSARK